MRIRHIRHPAGSHHLFIGKQWSIGWDFGSWGGSYIRRGRIGDGRTIEFRLGPLAGGVVRRSVPYKLVWLSRPWLMELQGLALAIERGKS